MKKPAKRFAAFFLLAAMTLSLFGCGTSAPLVTTEEAETAAATAETAAAAEQRDPTGICVGYAKRDITPESPVPLAGYGNGSARVSQNVLDPLYVACVALRDEAGTTLLLYQLDLGSISADLTASLQRIITKATGVKAENILLCVTHTHSAPGGADASITNWMKKVYAAVRDASISAIADLDQVVSAEAGRADTDRLNFIRRYFAEDGFVSDAYDSRKNGGKLLAHEFEADPEMQAVRFRRKNGRDVVLVNWQAHPHLTGGSKKYDVSADIVGSFRAEAEEKLGCDFIYFQGAAGGVNETSRFPEENRVTNYKDFGRALEETLELALASARPLTLGKARAVNTAYAGKVDHGKDYMAPQAQLVQNVWKRTANYDQTMIEAKKYGITSPYEADAIVNRAQMGETRDLSLCAYAFGDFALTSAPVEMFPDAAQDLKAASPFEMTFYVGYANGHFGYTPSARCFPNLGYEVMITYFVQGTAEEICQTQLSLLNQLKKD